MKTAHILTLWGTLALAVTAAAQPAGPMPDANRKGDNRRGKKDKDKDLDKDTVRKQLLNTAFKEFMDKTNP